MRPGQLTPNEFERAILQRLALQEPAIRERIDRLHVLSREYTGVGSFTTFDCAGVGDDDRTALTLESLIVVPGVPNGMGAVAFLRGGVLECLETFTYGDDKWDGTCDGFSIRETP